VFVHFCNGVGNCDDAHPYPNGEGIEGSHINVITLSWLHRRRVKVEYQYHPHHQKQQQGDDKGPTVVSGLEENAYQTEDQWEHPVVVVGFVLFYVFWVINR